MALVYLHFDTTEGDDGSASFDTMASATPAGLAALQGELARVLGWAHATFPGQRGPLDEGGTWDYDLQATQELTRAAPWHYDDATGTLRAGPLGAESVRHTVSLSLCGSAAFASAFQARFGLDGD